MKAITKDIHGTQYEYKLSTSIHCPFRDIIEIKLFQGVKMVVCWQNHITELKIPKSVVTLYCWGNKIKTLNIPPTIKDIWCDKNVIGNLDELENDVKVKIYF